MKREMLCSRDASYSFLAVRTRVFRTSLERATTLE